MAYTAIENEDEKKEYFDSPEELEVKVEMLADMIKASSTFCAFTGAGISTACGIPDYRSGFNTVMETGPGGWETAANKEKYKKLMVEKEKKAKAGGKKEIRTSIQKAYPSFTHMSLFELCERERLKFIISQNVDGLHRKSGVPAHCLAELHGNTNLEVCEKCGTEYMRDMRVRNAKSTKEHRTGRKCDNPSCQGPLKDTIINFNENLNDNILEMGFQMAGASDLILCMGSSMRVSPACEMPVSTVQNGGNLVMINLQKTPIDGHATLILNGKCDDIMRLLMKKLDYDVPVWQMKKRIRVQMEGGGKAVSFMGVDANGAPYVLFKQVEVIGLTAKPKVFEFEKQAQPYVVPLEKQTSEKFTVKLTFFKHYAEPGLLFDIDMEDLVAGEAREFLMVFDAGKTGQWELVLAHDNDKQMLGPVEFRQDLKKEQKQ